MKVIVVGAGIGGLTLAQALVGRGIEVVVLDRDLEISRTGGYRLHINTHAYRALRSNLPSSIFAALDASSAPPESFERMHVTDRRLRVVATVTNGDRSEHLMIGRVALRTLLARGLANRLRTATTVVGYESTDVGVDVVTDTGERISGDLIVAADGARSVIAEQAAGRAMSSPVDLRGCAGTVPMASMLEAPPPILRHGPVLAVGPRGTGLFLTLHCPRRFHRSTGETVEPIIEPASLIWGLIATERAASTVGSGPMPLTGVDRLLGGWSPWVRKIVGKTDPRTLGNYVFRAADPSPRMVPWTDERVTALGDAVHAMPPPVADPRRRRSSMRPTSPR